MRNPDAHYFLNLMVSFVEEAGRIALDNITSSQPGLKPDASVITQTDLKVSALAAERLAPVLAMKGHVLVDEEDPRRGEYLDESFLEAHPYVWSLDPIDATRAYANQMPHYGISIGLIHDRRPWLGVVYFPSLGELLYCDGASAYFVQRAFTPSARTSPIVPQDEVITSRSVFISTDQILTDFNWVSPDCHVMIFAAAVCEFCWPALGRACGSLSKVYLWDMAGSWPIFEKAGLKLFSLADGTPLDRLDVALFEKGDSPWKLKDYYILSSERNFPLLKARLLKNGV
jgi:fructose-1,6-bisphosphatase/inositol monophosphatase family enzyme